LATFDRDSIPNSEGVNPYYDSPWYDEDSNHSMPYTYYTTGICWRNDIVKPVRYEPPLQQKQVNRKEAYHANQSNAQDVVPDCYVVGFVVVSHG
jgi:spermidine/putrescine-binding protein